jgi:hypothetical protein
MATAKAISLSVRPTQSADLCYPISGIIEYQPESLLGQTVSAYDLITLKNKVQPVAVNKKTELLGVTPTDPNSLPSLLGSLSTVLKHRHDLLAALYQAGGTDAVTNTAANSNTTSQTTGGQAFSTTS